MKQYKQQHYITQVRLIQLPAKCAVVTVALTNQELTLSLSLSLLLTGANVSDTCGWLTQLTLSNLSSVEVALKQFDR